MTVGSIAIRALRGDAVEESSSLEDLPRLFGAETPTVWVDLASPSPAVVSAAAGHLGLHPLIVEDIVERNNRAKVEHFGGLIHVVLFALEREGETQAHEIEFVLGPRFLLTVRPPSWEPLRAHQLRAGAKELMRRGPDAVLWALADSVVDGYFPIFDELGDTVDELQDRVLERADPRALEEVFALKRELIVVRHAVAPAREIFNQLTSREYDLIREPQVLYFRDVYDHLIRLTDELDALRDLSASTIELYLSTVNNNLGTIMKRLTGVTVVLAGIGAVAGIFGMSEANIALAGAEGMGFWIVTAAMVVLAGLAVLFLRRIGWI